MSTFVRVKEPAVYLEDVAKLIGLSRAHDPSEVIDFDTIFCLIYNNQSQVHFSWVDASWTFQHSDEQIISGLEAELPWILMPAEIEGETTVVLGQLKDAEGGIVKAYRRQCNAERVLAALSA